MDTHEEAHHQTPQHAPIERVQIGVRMEKRMVKVLKSLAEYHDLTLGDLLEGIVLHAFESRAPFNKESLRKIAQLKEVYGMEYGAEASHRLTEATPSLKEAKNDTL
jgi:hypothetical protein